MRRYADLVCAWGGIVFSVLFGIGFLAIARFVPPLEPSATAAQTAAIFRADTNAIRTGLLLCYVGCPFFLAFGAIISAQTRRIAGVPVALVHLQIAAYASGVLLIAGPFMIWWVAAFRPDEMPVELIQTLNDFGWISFLIGWVPFFTWFVATGVAILCDTGETPVYPRWSGFLSLFVATTQALASFLIYFKTGPFAWNSIFPWWIPAADFFLWFIVMTALTTRAVNAQHRSTFEPDSRPDPAPADRT